MQKFGKQLTLLDLVLQQDDHKIPTPLQSNSTRYGMDEIQTYNQLGISLFYDANMTGNEQFVTNSVFRVILKNIEDKLLELETRIDNKDTLHKFTFQIDQLKNQQYRNPYIKDDNLSQDCKHSQLSELDDQSVKGVGTTTFHKPSRSRSTCTNNYDEQLSTSKNAHLNPQSRKKKQTEETTLSKLNLFEKKIQQLQEQLQKNITKEDNQFRKIEQQVQAALKDTETRLLQNAKSMKEFTEGFSLTHESQREVLNKLQQLSQQLNHQQTEITRLQEDCKLPYLQIEQTIAAMNKLQNIHNEQILQIRESLQFVESDVLSVMKNYKDLIMDRPNRYK